MGLGQSTEGAGAASSPEELSYVLAERFAVKCFTPLELTHFKDNFFSRARDNAGLKYWDEQTLSNFLGIPDGVGSSSDPTTHDSPLDAGPVVFRMVSYLGAFPFQSTMAPSVLTFEAMVKVVVLLTERYGKVLRRGRKDRIRLLFGSLADVGRKDTGRPTDDKDKGPKDGDASLPTSSHVSGFAVDEPGNDDDEEDEDDLALAALESLDAIEVFKHDQRVHRGTYEARISLDTFHRLLMLLLVIAPLKALDPASRYTCDLSMQLMEMVQKQADSIMAAFTPKDASDGISYKAFQKAVCSSLPYLFDPLTPLFEHFLFSKNLDLSQRRDRGESVPSDKVEKSHETPPPPSPSITLPGSFESSILNQCILAHISFFLTCSPSGQNLFRSGARLHPVFSASEHGSSLTSFSHHVLTWQSATLLVLQGTATQGSSGQGKGLITLGVYLPEPWKSSSSTHASSSWKPQDPQPLPCLFQLSPKHMLLQGNPALPPGKPNTPAAHFSTHSGIAIGCQIPPPARSQHLKPTPRGAGSLIIDTSLETAALYISPIRRDGVFIPHSTTPEKAGDTITKTCIEIYSLEVWGFLFPDPDESGSMPDAVELQRAMWNFEAREAERRRNINLKVGGDPSALENARWLLETAGLAGGGGRSGGSV